MTNSEKMLLHALAGCWLHTVRCTAAVLCAACCLTACHDDNGDEAGVETARKSKHSVTFINSENGAGDNGYNDIILNAEMTFAFLSPEVKSNFPVMSNFDGAEQCYRFATRLFDDGDSILVVLNSSDYKDLARSDDSLSAYNESWDIRAADLRVLLFEDNDRDLPQLVHSFYIQRYGACYVAGRLMGKMPALVVAAMKGDRPIDDAVQGFIDGYSVENPDGPIVEYIANDASGYANPERAAQICDSVVKSFPEDMMRLANLEPDAGLCILPLAGGSNVGMYGYAHSLRVASWDVNIIGMDKNYNNNSESIPFSIEIPLYDILMDYLVSWENNETWPKYKTYGLDSEYPMKIALPDDSYPHMLSLLCPEGHGDSPKDDKEFLAKLDGFIKEAAEKERAYMEMRK